MVLFYSRINWENYPSVVTPINEINLNKIDYAAKTLDERTVELYNTKAEKSVVLNTVSDWSLDEETGIITIKKVNGEVINFDLNIEKIPVNFELSEDGILIMTTDDGSIFKANIGEMIPVFSFENSETISFAKRYNRTVIATDFSSYEYEILEPFKGQLIATVVTPENSEMIPAIDQFDVMYTLKDGLTYHTTGKSTEKEISISINENVSKITITSLTENNIISLEIDDSKEVVYKAYVKDGSIKDKHLEENYLANIRTYAENANLSETESSNSAKESKSYAVGGTGTREGEDTDNAKYYMQEAKRAAQSGGGGGGSIDLPVSIDNGGTGATTAKEAQYNLLSDISERTEEFTDDDYSTVLLATPNETNGLLSKFKITLLWDYIKEKISSVLGLTETNYNGTSAKATADADGKVFSETYATKTNAKKVSQSSSDGTMYRAVLLGNSQSEEPTGISDTTGETRFSKKIYANPFKGELYAKKFYGEFVGSFETIKNLITTVEGNALDATMGKKLNDNMVGFLDTDSVIGTLNQADASYTATQDLWCNTYMKSTSGNAAIVSINNVTVFSEPTGGTTRRVTFPVKKGQTVKTRETGTYEITFYKMLK